MSFRDDERPRRLSYTLDRRSFFAGGSSLVFLSGCGGGGGSSSPSPAPTPLPSPSPTPAPTPSPTVVTQFGVNFYDLFYKYMSSSQPFDPAARLKRLRDRGVTLARFSAGPFWPKDWKAWDAAPEAHLKALDQVYDAADALGMHLIASVLWIPAGLSDHLGERYSAWGKPESASRRYMEQHVRRIVQRHVGRPSLFMWEFANEMNIYADLPNGHLFFPRVDLSEGTLSERTPADKITIEDVRSVYAQFESIVRAYDNKRLIVSGSGIPRHNQINGAQGSFALDTREQFAQAMEQTMGSERKTLSIHFYDKDMANRFDSSGTTLGELLAIARQTADKHGAKLILGETGVPKSGDDAADRQRLRAIIADIRAAKVDHALLWNYDWDFQPEWSISAANGRDWMLDEIAAANS